MGTEFLMSLGRLKLPSRSGFQILRFRYKFIFCSFPWALVLERSFEKRLRMDQRQNKTKSVVTSRYMGIPKTSGYVTSNMVPNMVMLHLAIWVMVIGGT